MIMQTPKISIIVPVYNVEVYLHRCINSILSQTFPDFEVLLINDGSTDRSGMICDEFAKKDSRIRVFHKENGGVSSARNFGLENVKGEWISFVDADDWIESNYCDTLISVKEKTDLIFFTAIHHYTNGMQRISIPYECRCDNPNDIENTILDLKTNILSYEFFGFTWNKFFRKQIIDKYNIRFIQELSVKEDEIFTTNYCRYINSLLIIPRTIYNYRVLNTGLTAKRNDPDELILLAECIKKEIAIFNLTKLINYEYNRVIDFYFSAIDNMPCISNKFKHFNKLHKYYIQKEFKAQQIRNRTHKLYITYPSIITFPIYLFNRFRHRFILFLRKCL